MSGSNLHAYSTYMPNAAFPGTGTGHKDPPLLPVSSLFVCVYHTCCRCCWLASVPHSQLEPVSRFGHHPQPKLTVRNAQLCFVCLQLLCRCRRQWEENIRCILDTTITPSQFVCSVHSTMVPHVVSQRFIFGRKIK